MLRRPSFTTLAAVGLTTAALAASSTTATAVGPDLADSDLGADVVTMRVAGPSRYGTSGLLSQRVCGAYATGYLATAVTGPTGLHLYLASGNGFADGLSVAGNLGFAGPALDYPNRSDQSLSGRLAGPGPLLLTEPTRLRPDTLEALDQISRTCGIQRITILGGTSAVSATVETTLRTRYGNVDRLGGRDRYATSVALAAALALRRVEPPIRQVLGPLDTAIITTGRSFADAVAAGVLATRLRIPILLNDGPVVRSDVAAYLLDNSIRTIYIVGGTSVVPATIDAELLDLGSTVIRLAGQNRFDTAAQVAAVGFPRPSEVVLTNGFEFADALSVTPFAAIHGAPVLLTTPDLLPAAVNLYLTRRATERGRLWIIGGTTAVSESVAASAATAFSP